MRKDYDFSKGKRGAVVPSTGKTRITIMLDDDLVAHFREVAEAEGTGYRTLINATLRAAVAASNERSTLTMMASNLVRMARMLGAVPLGAAR